MEKINIAELLKDCPKGMELYSPLCGKCVFDRLNMGTIICKKQNTQEITFTSEGYYMLPVFDNCECMIFPSKDQRDWSKFQRPFKDGDVLSNDISISIYNGYEDEYYYGCYVALGNVDLPNYFVDKENNNYVTKGNIRFATEEEKQKLFDAIKTKGYKWNAETKTLEKLIEPKFKAGDRIVSKNKRDEYYHILHVAEYHYMLNIKGYCLEFKDQDNFELVSNKFDITTLKPFDKVLVRDNDEQKWTIDYFSFVDKEQVYPFVCAGHYTNQCIPYDQNKHLLGTNNECNEYYKTWE